MRIDLDNYQDIERDEAFDYTPRRRRRKKKRSFIKIMAALLVAILVVTIIGYLTLKFFIGPIIKTVDGLPNDFPTGIDFYQTDQAQINLENQAGKEKMISGLIAMPDWVLNLFLNFLSDDLKKQLADNFGIILIFPKILVLLI